MRIKTGLYLGAATIALALALAGPSTQLHAQAPTPAAIDNGVIGGVVTGPNGPEAGVWVIAETKDLPTRFAKIVVTDDQGRYLLPDLPKAKYQIWVRGYGLVDSRKVESEPGKQLNLTAVVAPSAAAAAQYYPAIYWWSMLKIPEANLFGAAKSDIPDKITQTDWIRRMKNNGCVGCHQMGTLATRTIPAVFGPSSKDAWIRRIQAGQAGENMVNIIAGDLGAAPLPYLASWTDRIAAGELPRETPKRPEGVERNIVVTTWDWSDEKHYLHDLISSDKRNPTVNGYGPLFGQSEYSWDNIPMLDPVKNSASLFHAPIRDPNMHEMLGPGHAASEKPLGPSAYWGEEKVWDTHINNHNATIDSKGRVWLTAAFRNSKDQPAWCKQDSGHPSAKLFPINETHRTLAILEPKTMKYTFVDTCYGTHHLNFAYDANQTLWTSGGGPVLGWFNTKLFDETGDAGKAQGWTTFVLDTNGDGKRGEYTEPNQPFDPSKDRRIPGGFYAVSVNPNDGSIWGTVGVFGGRPGVVRVDPGPNPPQTALSEIYYVPSPGYGIRGGDIDTKGVMWISLGSGHMASFDRSKCKGPLNGPKATGDHCPEGWAFHKYPGPGFEGIGDNSAESSYYTWVDQHNTSGLGNDVPISTANLTDGLAALKDGKMITLRLPYPMGFYAKGLDGRIDDPNAGWKGRGLWVSSGDRAPWQVEGGKGRTPMAVHFQVRPDPLAR